MLRDPDTAHHPYAPPPLAALLDGSAALLGGYIAPQIAKRVSPLVVKRVACVGLMLLALNIICRPSKATRPPNHS